MVEQLFLTCERVGQHSLTALLSAILVFNLGCTHLNTAKSSEKAAISSASNRIEEAAYRDFHGGFIYRPLPISELEDEPNLKLAPLLLWECYQLQADLKPQFFKLTLDPTTSQVVWEESGIPVVYMDEESLDAGGEAWTVRNYVFRVGFDGKDPESQALRIWHAPNQMPVLWEILQKATSFHLVYLSEDWEMRIRSIQTGSPGGNQIQAVDLSAWPYEILVPRLLSDGPIPMGPWVYMGAGTVQIEALLCRCMESQLLPPVETFDYQLIPTSTVPPPIRQEVRSALSGFIPVDRLLPGFNWTSP